MARYAIIHLDKDITGKQIKAYQDFDADTDDEARAKAIELAGLVLQRHDGMDPIPGEMRMKNIPFYPTKLEIKVHMMEFLENTPETEALESNINDELRSKALPLIKLRKTADGKYTIAAETFDSKLYQVISEIAQKHLQ